MVCTGSLLSFLCIQKQRLQEAAGIHLCLFQQSRAHQYFASWQTKRRHGTSKSTQYHRQKHSWWFLPSMDKCRNKNKACHTGCLKRQPSPYITLLPGNSDTELWLFAEQGRETANSPSNCLNMKLRIKSSLLSSLKLIFLYAKVQINISLFTTFPEKLLGKAELLSKEMFATRSPADQKF